MATLKNDSFKGKTVVPFCTSGSSGIKQSVGDLQKAIPGAQIPQCVGVRSSLMDKMPAAVDRVLIEMGLIEGENEVLADYSAQQAPTADENAIFDAAISTYDMMKGMVDAQADKSVFPPFTFEVGNQDTIVSNADTENLANYMKEQGIQVEYIARDGIHNWNFWQECLPKALKKVGESFSK